MSCCDQQHQHDHHERREEGEANQQQMIEGQSEEERLRLRKARLQKKHRQMNEIKKKYSPLLKFLKSSGLKFKTAAVQKTTVQYFRIDHLKELLQHKKEEINKNEALRQLVQNWPKLFLFYQRIENQPNLKWPKQLQKTKNIGKFASFPFDSAESSRFKTVLILVAVISLVLFPLWPYELKYVIWYISYYIVLAIVGIIILRLVIYTLFSVFGASLWLFPRFFDNVEIVQSFVPVFSIKWWEGGSVYNIVTRLIVLSIFCYYGISIYNDPTIVKKNMDITKTILDDIDNWGVAKIKGQKNFSQSALTDYSKLLNKTIELQDNDDDDQVIIGESADQL